MSYGLSIAIAIVLGLLIGISVTFLFNILPESWLQDYGYDPKAPDFRLSKRMKLIPHGLFSAFLCAAAFATTIYTYNWFTQTHYQLSLGPIHMAIILLTLPICCVVIMSDRLNRIIPDQCWIALLFLGIVGIFADIFEGSLWYSNEAAWYAPIIGRILGAVIGGGSIWLIEFLCETFLGKEGFGQGDIKLLGGCGMLVGAYGLVVILYVSIFSALIFAIPLFIKKRIRIKKEEEMIRNSDNPVKARRELREAKAKIHFADDPDYLAFGPFISLGAVVFLVIEPWIWSTLIGYYAVLGVYF